MSPWGLGGMLVVALITGLLFARHHWEGEHPKVTSCYQQLATSPDSGGNDPLVSKCYTERR